MRKTESDMEVAVDMPRLTCGPGSCRSAGGGRPVRPRRCFPRVADSDRDAFEILYHRYVRSVFGLALRRLRNRPEAEEVTQEAFTAVWRSAASYRPERGSAGGWLYTVARNAIVDRMRRNGRVDTTSELPELASPESGPDEQAEQAYTAWRVHRALEELTTNERK